MEEQLSLNLIIDRTSDTIGRMIKLIRTTFRQIVFITILLCLFFINSNSFAFFKKPHWFNSKSEQSNFWTQLGNDFAIECEEANPYVQRQIQYYQQHPRHLQRILKGSEPFIQYVYEQTKRQHLPAELALIPLLESQYNPTIGARSGAAGLWQMMPGTARKFGLSIHRGYDGRKDVTASTRAALTYLSYLYRYFNQDWLLALAAYEAGEGKVQAIANRTGDNFWNLPLSKNYVPKILAIAHIIKQPHLYHLSLPSMANVSQQEAADWQDANVIASAQEPGQENKTADQTIALPEPKDNTPLNVTYQIKKGDTLTAIAKHFHVTVDELRHSNHLKTNKLKINSQLQIHSAVRQDTTATTNTATKATRKKYTIKKGDTLTTIAKKSNTTVNVLKKLNHLKNEKHLRVGNQIVIP